MRLLQALVLAARPFVSRGWSPALQLLAKWMPSLRRYPSTLSNGTIFYLDLRQRMCHGLFFMRGQPHEYGTEKALLQLLHSGDTFIDVGANVGYYTVAAGQLVGPSGRVVAIEPQPQALSILRLNAQNLGANVIVVPSAVSDLEGETSFYIRSAGDTSSFFPDELAREIKVKVETLDNLCEKLSAVNFVKIDVEGYEMDVLRGARKTLSKHRPWVYFELLDEMVTNGRISVSDIAEYFGSLDYVCNWVSHRINTPLLASEPSTYVLASPAERLTEVGVVPSLGITCLSR